MHSSHPSPRASGSTLMPVQTDKVIEIMLQCMSPEMARNGPPAMSAVRSLSGVNRTSHRKLISVAIDPQRKLGMASNAMVGAAACSIGVPPDQHPTITNSCLMASRHFVRRKLPQAFSLDFGDFGRSSRQRLRF
jgi:hypothetical protein